MNNQIRFNAADPRTGMTLRELVRLVESAAAAGLPGDAVVTGQVADQGQLLRLTVREVTR